MLVGRSPHDYAPFHTRCYRYVAVTRTVAVAPPRSRYGAFTFAVVAVPRSLDFALRSAFTPLTVTLYLPPHPDFSSYLRYPPYAAVTHYHTTPAHTTAPTHTVACLFYHHTPHVTRSPAVPLTGYALRATHPTPDYYTPHLPVYRTFTFGSIALCGLHRSHFILRCGCYGYTLPFTDSVPTLHYVRVYASTFLPFWLRSFMDDVRLPFTVAVHPYVHAFGLQSVPQVPTTARLLYRRVPLRSRIVPAHYCTALSHLPRYLATSHEFRCCRCGRWITWFGYLRSGVTLRRYLHSYTFLIVPDLLFYLR